MINPHSYLRNSDQQETDRYWRHRRQWRPVARVRLVQRQVGRSWEITPRVLTEARAAGGQEAKRAFDAMTNLRKLDVAMINAARRG